MYDIMLHCIVIDRNVCLCSNVFFRLGLESESAKALPSYDSSFK